MTDLPLAFALGRCPRMEMRAQQTDNRRETHKAHYGSEGALCRPNDLLSTLGGYEPSGGKVQENITEQTRSVCE